MMPQVWLQAAIWLPLATGLLVLLLPSGRVRAIRGLALAGTLATIAAVAATTAAFDRGAGLDQLAVSIAWIPSIGARYHTAVDGISLAMLAMTSLVFAVVALYVLRHGDRPKSHAFLFLLMQTGLMGLFAAQDLVLFYLFFEVGLVPMYFIIAGWGHAGRRHAAMKFFLYTRAGSLAMLLSFLTLYLFSGARSFSIPELAGAHPLMGAAPAAALALFGMLLGFGVKVPIVPIHNWLPDAHVEAPTEGSVVLAAVQLKMGGYGLVRVLLTTLPEEAARWSWLIVVLGIASLVYGVLAAMAQSDLKRLIAYSSIAHMGYVTLGVGVAAASAEPGARELAVNGAVYQMVSHALLTGGMFLMAGMLEEHAGTREIPDLGGLSSRRPGWSALFALLAFGSLGLPGLSGFVAELQVIGATVKLSAWAAVFTVLGLALTTGLYIHLLTRLLMGEPPASMPAFSRPRAREVATVGVLVAASLVLGITPRPLLSVIGSASRELLELERIAQLGGGG